MCRKLGGKKQGPENVEDVFFSYEKETKITIWEQDFLNHKIESAIKTVEFVNDRMSYIDLRGRC